MKENKSQKNVRDRGKNDAAQEKSKSRVQEYIEVIIIAILLAVVIRTFVVQAYKIPSQSMAPTLLVGVTCWCASSSTA